MTYGSVCSGIEAAAVAWRPLNWKCAFVAEIDKFPCAVLKHHYPEVPNYGDITKYKEWPEHAIDVLVGGTPCQSYSVAGLRAGILDPRGNLALVFLGIVDRYRPRYVVWENVPGVHSSWTDAEVRAPSEDEAERLRKQGLDPGEYEYAEQTNDFDLFISGLAELGYGVATAILDAQYFNLAQRRERVFVVGCAGGEWKRAAAVLFDSSCVSWNSPPRRTPRQRVAPTIEGRAGRSGANNFATSGGLCPTLDSRASGGGGWGTDFMAGGGLAAENGVIPIQEIGRRESGTPMNGVGHGQPGDPMFTLQSAAVHGIAEVAWALQERDAKGADSVNAKGGSGRMDFETETLLVGSLKAEGFDGMPDGTGRGMPVVPIAFSAKDHGNDAQEDLSPTLRSGVHDKSHANGGVMPAVAFQPRVARNGRGAGEELAPALNGANSGATSDSRPCVAFQVSKDTYADAAEADTVEVLRSLRNEIGEKAFAEWGLGILASFLPQEVLRPAVHGTGLRCPSLEEFGLVHYALSREEDRAARLVREMRKTQCEGHPSFRWEPHEQRTVKLAAYLSELSYPPASARTLLRHLRLASEGAGLLRETLSKIQEVGQSDDGEAARSGRARVRRLLPTECEFLQGFPRNFTKLTDETPDSPRYRALGNSFPVPVIRWLGERIELIDSI